MTGRRIVDRLIRERDTAYGNGIYVPTQIQFAWNSNHMEGSTLTARQTAQLFATGMYTADREGERVRPDDAIETRNHFTAFRWILDHVDEPVDHRMVRRLHAILKQGTMQATDPGLNVGGYKRTPNVIGGLAQPVRTAMPEDVPRLMERLFDMLARLDDDPVTIARAHWMFERIHPFPDGNGRVGRLVMFKELLRIDALPFVIHDSFRDRYLNGLSRFPMEPGYLVDTLLFERDLYREHILLPAGGGNLDYTYNDRWDEHAYRRTTQPDDIALARRIDQAAQPMIDQENERQARLLFGDPPSPDTPRQDGRPSAGPSL